MEVLLRVGLMPNSIGILVRYIALASYLHIYESAITLPKNITIPAILIFGDSIVDPGNNNDILTNAKANYPPYGRDFKGGIATGRFSNGKVPSDLIAEVIGIKELVPPYRDPSLQISDLITGVSFASGGAGYDPFSAASASAFSLQDQLKFFREYINRLKAAVGENRTSSIVSQSVYFIFAGSNDITNSYPFKQLHYSIPAYSTMLVNWASAFVQELYDMGARRIGVTNAAPCGCLPSQRTVYGGVSRQCAATPDAIAVLYNKMLRPELRSLRQKLSGSAIAYIDIYTPLLNLIRNPSRYGFEVGNRGCCGTGNIEVTYLCAASSLAVGTCPDASKYVFWDSFHPTQAAYKILVDDITQQAIREFLQ